MKTPYTTKSGVQIGCMYVPQQKPYHDKDACLLQSALLAGQPSRAEMIFTRILRPIWRWL